MGVWVLQRLFQRLRGEGRTTRSVVHAIFLVIVADALFSVVLSALDI